ncbi:MAG TPA: hypothetical protein VG966_13560 [Hyphomicrobiaceae bacterium]|nr:hypothetical protein [Hyphomicrobiaceae bacterium]
MNDLTIIAFAKLIDWPTIALGLCCGLLATSWRHIVPLALVASLLAELLLTQVRGWSLSASLFAIGAFAALPWVVLGHLSRALVQRLRR